MEGNYTYRPLRDARNIRILILEPSQNLTDPLLVSLQEASIEQAQYTALSYSWSMEDDSWAMKHYRLVMKNGDSCPTKTLILEGVEVSIGENLRDALRRLREGASEPLSLWVDAICIHQSDDAEKSVQVAMMGDIYKNALKVVAWLGEGNEMENRAMAPVLECLALEFSLLPAVSDHHPADGDDPETPSWMLQHEWMTTLYPNAYESEFSEIDYDILVRAFEQVCPLCRKRRVSGGSLYETKTFTDVEQLMRRTYFRRLWVIQEVLVPQSDRIVFQWGSCKQFFDPVSILWFQGIHRTLSMGINMEKGIDRPRKPTRIDRPDKSLLSILLSTNDRECFDPRDRLYAVIGIVPDSEDIKPDYRYSVATVYGNLARHFFTRRSLALILLNDRAYAGHDHRYPDHRRPYEQLPTWMPNLTHRFNFHGNEVNPNEEGSDTWERIWELMQPELSDDNMTLSLSLCYYGTARPTESASVPLDPQVDWEAHTLDTGHSSRPRGGRDDMKNKGLALWMHGKLSPELLEVDLTGCILCCAFTDDDAYRGKSGPDYEYRVMLRPDAQRPGRCRIVGTWILHTPDRINRRFERRRYHLV